MASLYAAVNNDVYLIEVGVFDTTATEVALGLRRATTARTQGTGQTEIPWDPDTSAATATAVDVHSVGPTLTGGFFTNATLGAAKGAGVIWTFGNKGIRIPKGTGNGLCVIPTTGTGQICDVYFIWDE